MGFDGLCTSCKGFSLVDPVQIIPVMTLAATVITSVVVVIVARVLKRRRNFNLRKAIRRFVHVINIKIKMLTAFLQIAGSFR